MASSTLDLPQMYQQPTYELLLSTLESIKLSPPVWNPGRRRSESSLGQDEGHEGQQRRAEITRYISTVIKSPLSWIHHDEQRDHLWELASKRMSERCGRTAMGDLVRKWPFDGTDVQVPFELVVREPALTGDLLGFKTWGSSYVLARHLPNLAATWLSHIFGISQPTVLELGSGTGLLGLAAAALWKAHVVLSDLPPIVDNLRANAETSTELIEARGGRLSVGALTWGGSRDEIDQKLFGTPHQFKIVLAADPVYDDNHPALLASAIGQHLAMSTEARAVVMVPKRDATTVRLLVSLKRAMMDLKCPVLCIAEDELAGADDWVEDDNEGNVCCWLGIFARTLQPAHALRQHEKRRDENG